MPNQFFIKFIRSEYAGSVLLLLAAACALVVANSPFHADFQAFLHTRIGVGEGDYRLELDITHWINDGLMAVFFLLVGLEIKREFLQGELASRGKAALPFICAIGGVIVPAFIFLFFNRTYPDNFRGWAIPTATDIAFALGILALGGRAVPLSLKVFLTALAIIDDLIAILIIALFYAGPLKIDAFLMAAAMFFGLMALNLGGTKQLWRYLLLGFGLWLAMMESGLHATMAGVLLALMIPLKGHTENQSPLKWLEERLHPLSSYIIMPLFALANAGLPLHDLKMADMLQALPLGIACGLFFGKQLGIFGAGLIAVRMKWAALPEGVSWRQFYAVAIIAGIGFTMSLFIGTLAFRTEEVWNHVRLGVLMGSVLSAFAGLILLRTRVQAQLEK